MSRGLLGLIGGRALQQPDLTLLYAAIFLSNLGVTAAFPLRTLYAQAHHATPEQIGLMTAVFFLAPVLAQLPLGWLVDSWGRMPILLFGMISHVLIGVGYIYFSTPMDLIILRFLEGVSIAAILPAVNAYIADVTTEEHRAEAYGVYQAATNGGMLIGPMIGGIIGQHAGFAAAYWVCVLFESLAVILIWGRVHEPQRYKPLSQATGKMPVGMVRSSRYRIFLLWHSLISVPLLGAYAIFFTGQVVIGMLSALWAIWITDLGGSYVYLGATFTVFALPQIFFGAIAGRASDRWGRGPLLLISGMLISLIYVAYGFTASLVVIIVLGAVEGLILIFQLPAAQSLLADASPAAARGRVQGVAGFAGAIGGAGSAYASLPLYHSNHGLPFILVGVVMAIGSILGAMGAAVLTRRQSGRPCA